MNRWKQFKATVKRFFDVSQWDELDWAVMSIAALIGVGILISTILQLW